MVLRRSPSPAERCGTGQRRVRVLDQRGPAGAGGRAELCGALYRLWDQRGVLRELLERGGTGRAGPIPRQHRGEHSADRVLTVRLPRLLFLRLTVPYPPESGVAIRPFDVLRLRARRLG